MSNKNKKIKKLGRYELYEEIGKGGMATVYRAFDTKLKRDVAIKVLHPHLISQEEPRKRFEREARAVAGLNDSSIVDIYDYDKSENDEIYIVMELVSGFTLRTFIDKKKPERLLSEGAALIARKIFMALDVAHNHGIVHRDVKPENILIDNDGLIRLSDFGIAYLAGIGQMTATGQILGSPIYMSPEHIENPVIDARADIFSVGILLYEMTVGEPPFTGNNPHQIIKRVVEGYYSHPLSVNPAIGHGIAKVIVKCLQQQPERRYQSAKDAVDDLETYLKQCQITDFDKEQKEFILSGEKWEQSSKKKIIESTLFLGKQARKNRNLPEAMNHLNRILALEPKNETALGLVDLLSKRRKLLRNLTKTAKFSIMALVILLPLLLLFFLGDSKNSISQTAEEAIGSETAQQESDVIIPPAPISPKIEEEDETKVITDQEIKEEAPPDSSPEIQPQISEQKQPQTPIIRRKAKPIEDTDEELEKRKVVFNPHPMNVEVLINNQERFIYKTTDRSRELPLGMHKIQFIPADKRLLPYESIINIEKGESPLNISARLKWKPATLIIKSNVDTVVASGGRAIGQTNKPIIIELKENSEEIIRILLSATGYQPIEKDAKVLAGKTTEMSVKLKKE